MDSLEWGRSGPRIATTPQRTGRSDPRLAYSPGRTGHGYASTSFGTLPETFQGAWQPVCPSSWKSPQMQSRVVATPPWEQEDQEDFSSKMSQLEQKYESFLKGRSRPRLHSPPSPSQSGMASLGGTPNPLPASEDVDQLSLGTTDMRRDSITSIGSMQPTRRDSITSTGSMQPTRRDSITSTGSMQPTHIPGSVDARRSSLSSSSSLRPTQSHSIATFGDGEQLTLESTDVRRSSICSLGIQSIDVRRSSVSSGGCMEALYAARSAQPEHLAKDQSLDECNHGAQLENGASIENPQDHATQANVTSPTMARRSTWPSAWDNVAMSAPFINSEHSFGIPTALSNSSIQSLEMQTALSNGSQSGIVEAPPIKEEYPSAIQGNPTVITQDEANLARRSTWPAVLMHADGISAGIDAVAITRYSSLEASQNSLDASMSSSLASRRATWPNLQTDPSVVDGNLSNCFGTPTQAVPSLGSDGELMNNQAPEPTMSGGRALAMAEGRAAAAEAAEADARSQLHDVENRLAASQAECSHLQATLEEWQRCLAELQLEFGDILEIVASESAPSLTASTITSFVMRIRELSDSKASLEQKALDADLRAQNAETLLLQRTRECDALWSEVHELRATGQPGISNDDPNVLTMSYKESPSLGSDRFFSLDGAETWIEEPSEPTILLQDYGLNIDYDQAPQQSQQLVGPVAVSRCVELVRVPSPSVQLDWQQEIGQPAIQFSESLSHPHPSVAASSANLPAARQNTPSRQTAPFRNHGPEIPLAASASAPSGGKCSTSAPVWRDGNGCVTRAGGTTSPMRARLEDSTLPRVDMRQRSATASCWQSDGDELRAMERSPFSSTRQTLTTQRPPINQNAPPSGLRSNPLVKAISALSPPALAPISVPRQAPLWSYGSHQG